MGKKMIIHFPNRRDRFCNLRFYYNNSGENLKQIFALSMIITIVCNLNGCAGCKDIGEEEIIERSSRERPSWTNAISDEKDGFIFVTLEMSLVKERAFGTNQANADGVQKLLNTMSNQAKAGATQALRGANVEEGDVGRFSEFAVSWISHSYQISGVAVCRQSVLDKKCFLLRDTLSDWL
jgi:hypothetical protein